MKKRTYQCTSVPADKLSIADDGETLNFVINGADVFLSRAQCRDLARQLLAWAGKEDEPIDITGDSFL